MQSLAFILLGLAVGVFSGVVGVGGGIVLVPALVLLFGFEQHTAQGTSMTMLVPPIGAMAAYTYYKNGYVDLKAAALLCLGFIIAAPLGAKLAVALPKETLRRVFGGVMIVLGARFIFGK